MFSSLAIIITLAIPTTQTNRIDTYFVQKKTEALRDAAIIMRASESLENLFQQWAKSKLQGGGIFSSSKKPTSTYPTIFQECVKEPHCSMA